MEEKRNKTVGKRKSDGPTLWLGDVSLVVLLQRFKGLKGVRAVVLRRLSLTDGAEATAWLKEGSSEGVLS